MCERTVGLTACSKSKRGEDEPEREFPARKLYDSWLFDGRVDALEAHCDEWAIFSAKHGYVEPDDLLTWYDKEITELPPEERPELAHEVVGQLPETDRVMILMGRDYADPLKAALPDDVEVWDPLEGVGMFDQRGELRDLATEGEQQRLITDGGRDRHADAVGRAVSEHAAAVMGLYMLYEWSPECSTCRQPRGVNEHCLECVFDPSPMVDCIECNRCAELRRKEAADD